MEHSGGGSVSLMVEADVVFGDEGHAVAWALGMADEWDASHHSE
ncbi:MAG: hypothetical protein SPI12_05475 [Actinomycetaceae bacterium]|nr:hypothetical protein [Actinomycetaceae bacterium]MDY6083291.1 hypothetical protein [Actinomycetaceae bacterium]